MDTLNPDLSYKYIANVDNMDYKDNNVDTETDTDTDKIKEEYPKAFKLFVINPLNKVTLNDVLNIKIKNSKLIKNN